MVSCNHCALTKFQSRTLCQNCLVSSGGKKRVSLSNWNQFVQRAALLKKKVLLLGLGKQSLVLKLWNSEEKWREVQRAVKQRALALDMRWTQDFVFYCSLTLIIIHLNYSVYELALLLLAGHVSDLFARSKNREMDIACQDSLKELLLTPSIYWSWGAELLGQVPPAKQNTLFGPFGFFGTFQNMKEPLKIPCKL